MRQYDFDLFVIGGGSGGVRAARMATQHGRVALAESGRMGGTCVNVGCIPKKLYSYAADYATAAVEAREFGWDFAAPTLDWKRLRYNRAREIGRLNAVYSNLLNSSGVTVIEGRATLLDPHTVNVAGSTFTAKHILVATGATPHVPTFPGSEFVKVSDDMFDVDPFPKRLLVMGGGYIACELASIFSGLGATTTLVHRGPQILRGFDGEVRSFLTNELTKGGLDLRLEREVHSISKLGAELTVTLSDGSQIETDTVLCATGRLPNTRDLGLREAGVELSGTGRVIVDTQFRSTVASIFAVGDVSSQQHLTPVALAEAMVVIDVLFGSGKRQVDYRYTPTAVFTHPNVATCGYSEETARAEFREISIFRTEFKPLRHTLSGSSERVFMKLVVDKASDRVLGVHMVGHEAGEIVQGFSVAVRAGVTKASFDDTIGIHPTMAEEFVTMRTPVSA